MKRLVIALVACRSHDHDRLDRHHVDASSPYMPRLCAFAAHDPDARRNEIAVVGDGPACTLRARDRDDLVPVRYARAHDCAIGSAAPNEEVHCWTAGAAVLDRYLFGDRELAVRGVVERRPELAPPTDRAFALAPTTRAFGKDRHTYWTVSYVERAPADDGVPTRPGFRPEVYLVAEPDD